MIWNALIAIDCGINWATGGRRGETICARAHDQGGFLEKVLDFIFGIGHCALTKEKDGK